MSRTTSLFMLISLALAGLAATFHSVKAVTVLPAGFVSEAVVTNLTGPTTIAFAPDGRMFIGQKDGRVRVFENGVLLPANFINISSQVNNNWDRGMLGIAIHPDFPNTPYVYLLFTYDPPGVTGDGGGARVSRLLRVTADPNNTNVALPGSEVVLLGTNSTLANIGNPNNNTGPASCESAGVYIQDCIAADSPSHTIGTVTFGTDGSLFVSSGDGAHFTGVDPRALRALSVDSLNGKILRIDPVTGEGYPNNPFYNGDPNSNRSKVYSLGLRNPFRTTVNTLTGELFIGDVGWNNWEEINTGWGRNFGWPCYEGNNTGSAEQGSYKNNAATSATCSALYAQGLGAVKAPTYAYSHGAGDSSVQAGAFYQGTVYPSQYQGSLFFSDYSGDWIRYLTFDGNGVATKFDFGTDVASGTNGGIVQLLVGPDTNLYYVAYFGPSPNASEVRRIRYTAGGNTPPTANASADPDSGLMPFTVNFSSAGSFDPDVQLLTYAWDFGDGNTSTDPNPSHEYQTNGNYMATLTVTDSLGDTGSDTVAVSVGNLRPVATILSPTDGFAYSTGDTISYNGTGVDNENGNLSGSSLQWDILLHHNQHIHFDFIPGLIGNTGDFPATDHGDNTWIELCLTVTDSTGLNDQDCVDLQPNTVTLTFDTVPSGLQLEYEGITYTTPFNVTTNANSVRDLIAPLSQQGCHNFTSWSDGGAASHQVNTGTSPQTYTATYTPCPITVTVNPNQSKVYGNANPTYTYTSSNPAATFTGVLGRAPGENVGTYAINQGTLAVVGGNYTITSFVPANFAITTKPITVTANSGQSKIFGSANPAYAYTSSDPAATFTGTLSRATGENVGTYAINQGTLAVVGGNYTLTSFIPANFAITPQSITVTANSGQSKVFGSANPAYTYTSSDPAATFTGTLGRATGENVGTYAINQGSLAAAGNYAITTFVSNAFAITAKPITVTVTPGQFKVSGSADPIFTYTSSDPAASFTGALSRVTGETVGTYTINQGTLAIVGGNYTITSFVSANFTITPLEVVSILRADVNPTAEASADFTVIFSGAVTGVDAGDFALATTGVTGASITNVSGSGNTYTVTVNTGSRTGTIRLNVPVSAAITALAGNPLTGLPFMSGQTYTVNKSPALKAPSLRSPRTNTITNNTLPTFWWTNVKGGMTYEIEVATDNTFATILDTDIISGLSHTVVVPLGDGDYYWRVRAYNASNQPGAWSSTRTFEIDTTGPLAPVLSSPADAVSSNRTPTFKWLSVPEAVLYEFQYDNDSDFSSSIYTVTVRSTFRRPPAMKAGIYYWHVRAKDASGNWGDWSVPFTVTITGP